MTIFGALCLSYSILFVLALFFALALCRVAAEADERMAGLERGKGNERAEKET